MSSTKPKEAIASPGRANASPATTTEPQADEPPSMSKNALKRLRRMQEWEDGKEERKRRRRDKRTATKARRREERATLLASGADPAVVLAKKAPAQLVPVALILDCGFEAYMTEKERVSLSSQVTRCYSENRGSKYRTHLWISGWGGWMRERFETAMEGQHLGWKGVGFEEGDFLAAAAKARLAMRSAVCWQGGKQGKEPCPLPELDEDHDQDQDQDQEHRDVVYLTSESPHTLDRLEHGTSYIIGGLVDKNREKGLCYRRALERGIRTAKLPIGQYMVMQSRRILATNHVVEIMIKWLEYEDWGRAFDEVIPKRKGGRLKSVETASGGGGDV